MKKDLNPIVAIVAFVAIAAVVIGGYWYFMQPRPASSIKYTPGVPPWKDKNATQIKPFPDYPPAQPRGGVSSQLGSPVGNPGQGR